MSAGWPRGYFTVEEPAGAELRSVVAARTVGPGTSPYLVLAGSVGSEHYEEDDAALLARVAGLIAPEVALLVERALLREAPARPREPGRALLDAAEMLATGTDRGEPRRVKWPTSPRRLLPFDELRFAIRLSEGDRVVLLEPGERRRCPICPHPGGRHEPGRRCCRARSRTRSSWWAARRGSSCRSGWRDGCTGRWCYRQAPRDPRERMSAGAAAGRRRRLPSRAAAPDRAAAAAVPAGLEAGAPALSRQPSLRSGAHRGSPVPAPLAAPPPAPGRPPAQSEGGAAAARTCRRRSGRSAGRSGTTPRPAAEASAPANQETSASGPWRRVNWNAIAAGTTRNEKTSSTPAIGTENVITIPNER